MADLSFKARGEPVNIVGIDKNDEGETNYMNVTDNQDAQVSDTCNTSAVYTNISVGNVTPVEVKVGASALAVRKYVHIQPKGVGIFWGYDSSVTTSNGTELFRDQLAFIPVGPGITVYLISATGTIDVRIGELA